jgi:hypothetical protein
MLDLKALGINAKTDKRYRLVGLQIYSNNNSGELVVPETKPDMAAEIQQVNQCKAGAVVKWTISSSTT